jgi:predicted nuclease of predicted toxin-antitoxin system
MPLTLHRDVNFHSQVNAPLDMNLTPRWVQELCSAGHHALHWSAAGRSDAPDSEICLFARENGYVIFTNDLDFPHILASSPR